MKKFQNRLPLRIKDEAVRHLAALPQFQGIHTVTLIRLAQLRTKLYVPSRWVAISLLRSNLGPIPVPNLNERPHKQEKPAAPMTRSRLILIKGGHIVR
jgi:hypothetical protein